MDETTFTHLYGAKQSLDLMAVINPRRCEGSDDLYNIVKYAFNYFMIIHIYDIGWCDYSI